MILSQSLANHMGRRYYRVLPDLPLVVVEGPPDSGKSTLLKQLDADWRQRAPVVRIALGGIRSGVRPHQIAVRVADALVRHPRVPRHTFPRLFLGVAALHHPLPDDLDEAETLLDEHLQRRARAIESVRRVVDPARQAIIPLIPEDHAGVVGAGLAAVPPLAWFLRKRMPAWSWFAHAVVERSSGLAGLVELNRWEHQEPVRHAEVDTVLLRAFLADLRSTFTRWCHADLLKHNVLLLIDDADTSAGGVTRLRFVDDLEEARRASAGSGDPLLVVATSGIRRRGNTADKPFGRDVAGPTGPAHVDLRGQNKLHVVDLTTNMPPEPDHVDVRDKWRRSLAAGHRGAYERFRTVELASDDEASLESLFRVEHAAAITEAALGRQPPPAGLERDLRIFSAISPDDQPANAFETVLVPSQPSRADQTEVRKRYEQATRFIKDTLWAGPESDRMHPLFRRAFLAGLSYQKRSVWDVVFSRLASAHDKNSALYHHYQLAHTEDVHGVARYLARRLDHADVADWLKEFDTITSAPRKRDGSRPHFLVTLEAALSNDPRNDADGRERNVAKAVSALWLSRNHRGGSRHEELSYAADAFMRLLDDLEWTLTRGEPLHARAIEYRSLNSFPGKMV